MLPAQDQGGAGGFACRFVGEEAILPVSGCASAPARPALPEARTSTRPGRDAAGKDNPPERAPPPTGYRFPTRIGVPPARPAPPAATAAPETECRLPQSTGPSRYAPG